TAGSTRSGTLWARKECAMGYREVRRMELQEVVRRWQAGESRRSIATALGLARMTVEKYVRTAEAAGLQVDGPPPTEDQVVALGQAGGAAQWETADRLGAGGGAVL